MSALVVKAGPLTTVQDLGRTGVARVGLSPGGAMDQKALTWANRLLGNGPDTPGLEVALGGLVLEFDQDTVVAVTGADTEWRAVGIEAGGRLELGYSVRGRFQYVAFPGGLEAPVFGGSASVVLREGIAGFAPLRKGSRLTWKGDAGGAGDFVPERFRPAPSERLAVSFVPGYEWTEFSGEDRSRFLQTDWVISPNSDRVATRLGGASLHSGPRVLDSVPLIDGTIQVLGNGTPLIFMRDRPTIGGYAKLGAVLPFDLDDVAQAVAGTRVSFTPVDAAEARRMAPPLSID